MTDSTPNDPSQNIPPMDFSTLILSIASSCMVSLGMMPSENNNEEPPVDLPTAKQFIDILGVLEEKTKNNLSKEETTLLEKLLYDLRLTFVDREEKPQSSIITPESTIITP